MKLVFRTLFFCFLLAGCAVPLNTALEEPKHFGGDNYIQHFAYSLQYNETHEQADWVAYRLDISELDSKTKRTNKFLEDTMVVTGTATNADYIRSGYDKGHLAPAADMAWNEQAMRESFYLSNISPQLPGFNRGVWKDLEEQVRAWAKEYNSLYIATGPYFAGNDSVIGENKVSIPTHFYKAVLIYNDTIQQAVAFYLPHKKINDTFYKYIITVDELEKSTGIDFFSSLPDRIERRLESRIDTLFWK